LGGDTPILCRDRLSAAFSSFHGRLAKRVFSADFVDLVGDDDGVDVRF
jgi:hypothetical protein